MRYEGFYISLCGGSYLLHKDGRRLACCVEDAKGFESEESALDYIKAGKCPNGNGKSPTVFFYTGHAR